MNNEKNKKLWLKKFAIIRFLNHYDEKTIIKKLTIDDLTKYF